METLIELPKSQWPQLIKTLQTTFPLNILCYHVIHKNMINPGVNEVIQLKIYCPFGEISSGFVITHGKDSLEYIICSISRDTRKMEEALIKTEVIDWSQCTAIYAASSCAVKVLNMIRPRMGFSHYHMLSMTTFFLDKNRKPFMDIDHPIGTYIGQVKPQDIQKVDENWAFRHEPQSFKYFSMLVEIGLSYALYSSDEDQILAWVFINDVSLLRHVYCVKKYRRRGYAEYLLKHVVNVQLSKGNNTYAQVAEDNDKSEALFSKLGFISVGSSGCLFVKRLPWPTYPD